MNLTDILSPDTIVPALKAKDRWQAIEELVDTLISSKKLGADQRDRVLAALKKREQSITTGIGDGVGIPHTPTEATRDFVGALGRSASGVDFSAMDNRPVHFVVLFLSPMGQEKKHLQVLSSISKFMHDKKFRDQINRAKDAKDILDLIKSHGSK